MKKPRRAGPVGAGLRSQQARQMVNLLDQQAQGLRATLGGVLAVRNADSEPFAIDAALAQSAMY